MLTETNSRHGTDETLAVSIDRRPNGALLAIREQRQRNAMHGLNVISQSRSGWGSTGRGITSGGHGCEELGCDASGHGLGGRRSLFVNVLRDSEQR